MRQFPQGNTMDETNLPKGNGNITQDYLSTNYKAWDITIRDEYKGMVNNNLMYNINPSGKGGNGANAIAQYPLSSKFMYGTTPQVSGANSEIYTRINPWLAEDINTLYKGSSITANIGRSNFASTSVYYKASPFYTDQRDAPIVLTDIIYYKG